MKASDKAAMTEKYKKFAEPGGPLHGLFRVEKVDAVGYPVNGLAPADGHPFCIGEEHVEYAATRCGGILGEEALSAHPCAMEFMGRPECGRPYSAHSTEYGIWVYLLRDLTNEEAAGALSALKEDMTKDGISGWAIPNLGKEFTVAPPEGK